jgi:uncharacterized membrane protein YphA (DoxX/SURF4 family)
MVTGFYWLYLASQTWAGVGWMRPLIQAAPAVNPLPGLHELLAVVVAPNWSAFALGLAVAETCLALLLITGLATRKARVAGFVVAVALALTIGFTYPETGYRWVFYLAVLVNAELVFTEPGRLALERARFVPAWLRS